MRRQAIVSHAGELPTDRYGDRNRLSRFVPDACSSPQPAIATHERAGLTNPIVSVSLGLQFGDLKRTNPVPNTEETEAAGHRAPLQAHAVARLKTMRLWSPKPTG